MTKNKSRNPHTKKGGRTLPAAKATSGSKTAAAGKSATTRTTTTKSVTSKTAARKTAVNKTASGKVTAAKKPAARKNPKTADAPGITERVVAAVENLKGKDIVCMDVRKLTDVTDTLIIVSGTSNRHVKSLADNAVMELKKSGKRAYNIEGAEAGEWVLVDFGDVVLHVMQPHIREFYDLEKLWGTPIGEADAIASTAATSPANKKPANKKPPPKKPADKNRE